MSAHTLTDAYFYRALPGADEIDRIERGKFPVDTRPLLSGSNTAARILPDNRRFYKHPASRHGCRNGYSTEDINKIHGERRYGRTKAAAKDHAYNDAHHVWVYIL